MSHIVRLGITILLGAIILTCYAGMCGSDSSIKVGNSVTYPSQVTLLSPANGATGVITTTSISWLSASGATSYDVYFGITSTGWSVVTNTASTNYTPGGLSLNTLYYWRIDSRNNGGTTTGLVWSFTTQP